MTEPDAEVVNWPQAPACYGWLSLDRRGGWQLRGLPVRHGGLVAFINANYGPDEAGNWVFRNGPQAVFVSLDYTPLVVRLEADGSLSTHIGRAAGAVAAAYLDAEGNVLLHAAAGIAMLDDRDLAVFVAECRDLAGAPATDAGLLAAMAGNAAVYWRGLPLQAINREDVPRRFGFRPDPTPIS